jgi:hypothetical protein
MPSRRRLLWFEIGPTYLTPDERAAFAAGLGVSLRLTDAAPDGRHALELAVAAGMLRELPTESVDEKRMLEDFKARFPDGLAASLDEAHGLAGFAALPPRLRKRLWRAALRPRSRRDLPYEITSFRRDGAVKLLFAVPRATPWEARLAWRTLVEAANYSCALDRNRIPSKGVAE